MNIYPLLVDKKMTPQLHWLPKTRDWSQRLTANPAPDWATLVSLSQENLDFLQTARLDKLLARVTGGRAPEDLDSKPVRLALLGSCTTDQLAPGLRVGALRHRLWMTLYTSAYGQYQQEAMDSASTLYAFEPDVALCAFDSQHLLGLETAASTAEQADAKVATVIKKLRSLWRLLRSHANLQIIQQTLLPTAQALMGSNEQRLPGAPLNLIRRINTALRVAADEEGVDLLSVDECSERDGLSAWHDARLWLRAKQYVAPPAGPAYGDQVARLIAARRGLSGKCLVLDLDNTLWGGVIGDDGLERIVLGQGSAEGEAFVAFQRYVRDLTRRGVILAVCSKNDEANALLPFTSHPEMVLKRDEIACFVANWQDKASNLRNIAQQLNIGIDSLVFVDDNPFERNLVRRELPMVRVPEMPEDPADYASCVAASGYFEGVRLTEEDRARAGQYQANLKREMLRTSHSNLDSYLRSLDMRLEWSPVTATDLLRVVQLIGKTNQFNLTTRRHDEADVLAMMTDPHAVVLHLRLKDSFGDNGIVAVVAALPDSNEGDWRIDTWLMSCRVLGRKVEHATLAILAEQATLLGARRLIGEYIMTAKNGMVKEHYPALGFAPLEQREDAARWVLDLGVYSPQEAPMEIRRA